MNYPHLKKSAVILGLLALIAPGIGRNAAAEEIKISGSEPMLVIVKSLAEGFTARNPEIQVSVTGGSTGAGFSDLIDGVTHIANAARKANDKEILRMRQGDQEPVILTLAIDNVCIIVHPSNPVTKLTIEEIRKIFAGEITTWGSVGGSAQPIKLYGREPASAQAEFVKAKLRIFDFSSAMQTMTDAEQVTTVAQDPAAIGFVGLAYAQTKSISTVKIAFVKGMEYLDPLNPETTRQGNYPLSRRLHQYALPKKMTPAVKKFLRFQFSEDGKRILQTNGVLPVSDNDALINLKHLELN